MAGQPMWVFFIASNMFSLMIKSFYCKENTSHTSQFSGGCLGVGSSLLWSSQWGWHYWWGGGGKSRGGTQRRDLQLLSTKCVILWRLIRVIIRPPEEVFTIFWWRTKLHNFEGGQKWNRQTEWSIEPFLEETVKIPTAWISKTKYHAHCETATNQPENYLIEKPENVSFKSHQYCSLSFIFRLYVINSSSAITSHVWLASRLAEVRKQMVLRCYNSTLRWEIWQT